MANKTANKKNYHFLKNKTVLITGASGFIGTNLILELLKYNAKLILIDRKKTVVNSKIKTYQVDLITTDFSFLNNMEIDYVVHLAALSTPKSCTIEDNGYAINVLATKRLLEKCCELNKKYKLSKFIFMSTVQIYSKKAKIPYHEESETDPNNSFYAATKIESEKICMQYLKDKNLPVLIFRLSNIYGPYQDWQNKPNLIPQLMSQAIIYKKITILSGKPIRDWIYIGDAIKIILKGMDSHYNGILNLASGQGISVSQIVKIVSHLANVPVYDKADNINAHDKIICSIDKLKKKINYLPKISIEQGLTNTYNYYKEILKRYIN